MINGIICINKPQNITSFSVCNKLSKLLHAKVGHCGTLDPNATGLLVCIVNKTKILPYINTDIKTYVAECKLFIKTDTGDIWGNVLENQSSKNINIEQIKNILNKLLTVTILPVPLVSAKKVNGKKLLEYYHKNIEIEKQYQNVTIYKTNLISFCNNIIKFEVTVSSGTYIRSICEWIGEQLNTVATMASLIRTEVGNFKLSDAIELNTDIDTISEKILKFENYLIDLEKIEITNINDIYHGKPLMLNCKNDRVFIMYNQQIMAVYTRSNDKLFVMERGLF